MHYFFSPIKKKCGDSKTITHKLRFIDSFTFMSIFLSELVDNMSGKFFNSIECKKCIERKKKLNQNAILLGLRIIN